MVISINATVSVPVLLGVGVMWIKVEFLEQDLLMLKVSYEFPNFSCSSASFVVICIHRTHYV